MRTRVPVFPASEIAADLFARLELAQRAQVVANWLSQLLPSYAFVVYGVLDQEDPSWTPLSTAGEVTVSGATDLWAGTLGRLAGSRQTEVLSSSDLQREDFAHLDVRHTEISLAYVPLLSDDMLVGAIELIAQEPSVDPHAVEVMEHTAAIAAPAFAASLNYESERNVSLESISRVTQMYDLEKVFNSTLEMDELLEMIAKKFAEVMNVQAVNLWMVNGDSLELVSQAGYDATVSHGTIQQAGEGVAADVSEDGVTVLIDDPDDERLQKRNGDSESPVFSLLAAPLMDRENLVGVVEALNKIDGQPFDEDDEFFLSTICETANNALHNADLLQAERKVEVLEALVKVSGEITSTLDIDRVMQAVVNEPATVIPYERAAIALEQRGKLSIRAITGQPTINQDDPDVQRLHALLQWASLSNEPMLVGQHDDGINVDREESRAKFEDYFAATNMRGFYSLPLQDDDGRLGILSFESSDPDFLSVAHLEMIKVLAGQATVALRNASLYREVPFIEVLEPILARKRKFLAMDKRRRALNIAAVAAVLVFLVVFPLPLRVSGPAVVAPAHTVAIQPEVSGVVRQVMVREGQEVPQGGVLASMDDWQYRSDVAAADSKYQIALAQMNRALASSDGAEAGILRAQADNGAAQLERAKERLARTILRAPIGGRVATPRVEDLAGQSLNPGDTFATLVDTSSAAIDIGIDELDAALLRPGQKVSVKLDALPNHTMHGVVDVVSPKGDLQGNERLFYARILVPNDNGLVRPGMEGRGKVNTGWRPAGWVLFRRPVLWAWSKLWSWFGW